ncbi:hypothetical protein MUO32_06130 [Shinella sp. CPCC 101442]|uniref:hypothetical protein n=1 Tax=Shinella sp. CPCC 101442 TaxID=2932265 RepID=UPI0021525944|nr:hypothetical protein [Shinella sp. CPCC 101442]MCR6498602.1 hypothetical protein [Shinella sp. CPCC 101442]
MPKAAFAAIVLLAATAAHAQEVDVSSAAKTMGQLVSEGYEIKAAAPNGSRYVVFMQNDQSAYACEFVNTTTTQCRSIN